MSTTTPSRKRKKGQQQDEDDSPEQQKKLSKAEKAKKRAEDEARAREWAEKRKAKKKKASASASATNKATASSSAGAATKATASPVAAAKNKSPGRRTVKARKPKAAAATEAAAATTPKATPTKRGAVRTPATVSKPTPRATHGKSSKSSSKSTSRGGRGTRGSTKSRAAPPAANGSVDTESSAASSSAASSSSEEEEATPSPSARKPAKKRRRIETTAEKRARIAEENRRAREWAERNRTKKEAAKRKKKSDGGAGGTGGAGGNVRRATEVEVEVVPQPQPVAPPPPAPLPVQQQQPLPPAPSPAAATAGGIGGGNIGMRGRLAGMFGGAVSSVVGGVVGSASTTSASRPATAAAAAASATPGTSVAATFRANAAAATTAPIQRRQQRRQQQAGTPTSENIRPEDIQDLVDLTTEESAKEEDEKRRTRRALMQMQEEDEAVAEEEVEEKIEKKNGILSRVVDAILSPLESLAEKVAVLFTWIFYVILACLAIAAVGGVIVMIYSQIKPVVRDWEGGDGKSDVAANRKPDYLPPCFVDSPGVPRDEDEAGDGFWAVPPPALTVGKIKACREPTVDCPKHGRCAHGFLVDCLGDGGGEGSVDAMLYKVSEATFAECVLSSEAERIVSTVQQKVVDLTVEQTCNFACRWRIHLPGITGSTAESCGIEPDNVLSTRSESDLKEFKFTVDGLVEAIASSSFDEEGGVDKVKITAEIVEKLEPHLDKDVVQYIVGYKADGKDEAVLEPLIGLTTEFVEHKLPLPTACWIGMLLLDLFWWVLGLVAVIVMAYPKSSIALSLFGGYRLSYSIKRRRALRVRAEATRVRELVYDKLALADGHAEPVLYTRDDLGRELYPNSIKKRMQFFETVWPLVVEEAKRDNCIGNCRRVADGKELDHWWYAHKTARQTRLSQGGLLSPGVASG